MIYGLLREADGPLTIHDLVRGLMEARGMNTADHAMVETMRLRLASALRKLQYRGKLTAEQEAEVEHAVGPGGRET